NADQTALSAASTSDGVNASNRASTASVAGLIDSIAMAASSRFTVPRQSYRARQWAQHPAAGVSVRRIAACALASTRPSLQLHEFERLLDCERRLGDRLNLFGCVAGRDLPQPERLTGRLEHAQIGHDELDG